MGFTAVKCPSCGANVELDESREVGFCSYCGAKIVQDKIVVEHRGSVRIEGTATKETLLERARLMRDDGKFSDADSYYDRVLDIDPHCASAYWGKLCCEACATSDEELGKISWSVLDEPMYKKAVAYSEGEEQKRYKALGQATSENQDVLVRKKQEKIYRDSRLIVRERILLAFDVAVILSSVITLISAPEKNRFLLQFLGMGVVLFGLALLLFFLKIRGEIRAIHAYKKNGQIHVTPTLLKSDEFMKKEKSGWVLAWISFGLAIIFVVVLIGVYFGGL